MSEESDTPIHFSRILPMKNSISTQKVSAVLRSMTNLNKSHTAALEELSVQAIEHLDNDQALELIEKSAVTMSKYKKGSSDLVALMKGDKQSKRIAAELLADAKRVLRVKDYAKFKKLVASVQSGKPVFDTGMKAFIRGFLKSGALTQERVERGALRTSLAKFGRDYVNNVASGERLLRALGLHSVETEGRTITAFSVTDVEGY